MEVGQAYPYPSHVIAPNFVTMKLSGKDTYNVWETQILCLLKSHQMYGFIDGQFPRPAGNGKGKVEDMEAWIISDSLVKGWILGSLSKEAVNKAVNHLTHEQNNTDFTAKDLWDELRRSYGPLAASTSNPCIIVNVGEAYPYPSLITPNIVTVKLSGKNKYNMWKTQMLCLLKSHQMYGFIDGQFPRPAGNGEGKAGDLEAWIISDSLVKGWIFGSLSEEAAGKAVIHLTHRQPKTDFTAVDLWDELQRSYGPSVREQAAETKLSTRQAESEIEVISESEDANSHVKQCLYDVIIEGDTDPVIERLERFGLTPTVKITNNGNTVLHVAVGSSTKNHHKLLKKLLEMTPEDQYTLLDLINSDESTLLHVAAIGANIEAVNMLVERNPYLLLAKDKEGHIPLALSVSNMHTKTSHCLFEHMKVYRYLLGEKEKEYDALLRGEVIMTCKTFEQQEKKYGALNTGNSGEVIMTWKTFEQQKKDYDALFTDKSGEELVVLVISCQDFRLAKMIINDYPDSIFSDSDAVLTALAQNFPREPNFWERGWEDELDRMFTPYVNFLSTFKNHLDSSCGRRLIMILLCFLMFLLMVAVLFYRFLKLLVRPFFKETIQIHKDATNLLTVVCNKILAKDNASTYHRPYLQYYTTSTFEATRRMLEMYIFTNM